MNGVFNNREFHAHVDPMFLDRWSPRAFSSEPVAEWQLKSLFEAARWAPSCYNEQPWLFLYATTKEDLALYRSLLVEGNREWADNAPVLAFALVRKHFARNNKSNDWAAFDTGAAWMSLALQARRMGLYAHGMAGFLEDKVYEALDVPREEYRAICAIAIGRYGDPQELPERMRAAEAPNSRKPLAEVAIEGKFPVS